LPVNIFCLLIEERLIAITEPGNAFSWAHPLPHSSYIHVSGGVAAEQGDICSYSSSYPYCLLELLANSP
jgi:hypothetical protein